MRKTDPVKWRNPIGTLLCAASVMASAACGSSATTSSPHAVYACSLLSKAEAAENFPTGSNYSLLQQAPTAEESYCHYPGATAGVWLMVNVTWSSRRLVTFEDAHSGNYTVNTGTLPSGQVIPIPHFMKVTISGEPAYWSARQPLPISGTTTYPSLMAAERDGYIVSLSASGLSETQNEKIMSIMLRRL